jgi:hypothetical protein
LPARQRFLARCEDGDVEVHSYDRSGHDGCY